MASFSTSRLASAFLFKCEYTPTSDCLTNTLKGLISNALRRLSAARSYFFCTM